MNPEPNLIYLTIGLIIYFSISMQFFSRITACLKFSDENKMGVQMIEFYFHKIDKIRVRGWAELLRFYKKM